MTAITREQALKIIEAADEVISALAGTNEDVHPGSDNMLRLWDDLNDRYAPPEVVRELARIVLASLEAEPVAFIGKRMLEDLIYSAISRGRIWSDVTDKISGESRIPLYTAPPALKVPDALPEQENYHGNDIDYMPPSDVYQLGKTRGWNACRAAMLQGKGE
ncbi:hypothetical protein MTQ57_03430 [Escherichia coli]|nr:hypothetical protein [Escherichia coli]